jgi:hypothetical protein
MRKALLASILLAIAAGASGAERRGMRVLENGIEAWARAISLPSQAEGRLQFQSCPTCKPVILEINGETQFFVGKQPVSYADLKAELAAKPNAAVLIVTPKSQTVVSRIEMSLVAVVN